MTIKGTTLLDAIQAPTSPFPGLRPFEFDESHLFFGRDGQVEKLISKLEKTRFLAVVGTSGSGKSSLVRAGLVPALLGGLMTKAGPNWRLAIMRPGNDPVGGLARSLNHPDVFGSDDRENAAIQIAVAEATLRRGSRGLVEVVRQNAMPENENLLVVVDQFEELFRFAREARRKSKDESDRYQNDAAAFVKLLLEAHAQPEANIFVVLTMRSDFLGDCAQFWDLPEAINESQYLIPRLAREQLREVITGPVALGGGEITSRLVTQLLNDIGDDQDQLPVLQHLLMRVWNERKDMRLDIEVQQGETTVVRPHTEIHQGNALDLCCYEAVGGMGEALSRHADEALDELPDERHRIVAEKAFKALTEKGSDNREIRRPIPFGELCAVTGASMIEVETVIEVFRKPGRSFLMPPVEVKLEPESLVDISHESLIRGWRRLRRWTDEEAQSARTYRRLAETAILYKEGKEAYLKDPALQVAQIWRNETHPNLEWACRYHPEFELAVSFLENSQRDAAKHRRRRIFFLTVAIAFMLGSSLLTLGYQRMTLNLRQSAIVEGEKQLKLANQLKEEAENASAKMEAQSVLLSINLFTQEILKQGALDAKAAALRERDNARRLQGEKQDQATAYGYFKTAFDQETAGERDKAVESLKQALTYFQSKGDAAHILSTHINIGDVHRENYRIANDPDESTADVDASESYDQAIEMLRSGDQKLLASVYEKAGSIWANSDDAENRAKAAEYYENAASVYHTLGQKDDQAARLIDKGKIFVQVDGDEEEFAKSRESFDRAIDLYSERVKKAEVSMRIGDIYGDALTANLKTEIAAAETLTTAPSASSTPQAESDRQPEARRRRTQHENSLREAAAKYFSEAARVFAGDGQNLKAATAFLKAAKVLSMANRTDLKQQAARYFADAASKYGGSNDKKMQTAVLILAGDVFRKAEDRDLWPSAETFYRQAVRIYQDVDMKEEEAETLDLIGDSYGESDDPIQKRKAIEYYEQAVSVYHNAGLKPAEVQTLQSIAGVLSEFDDPSQKAKALDVYEQAVKVYHDAGSTEEEANTLQSIAKTLNESDDPQRQRKGMEYYDRAVKVYQDAGLKQKEAEVLSSIGKSLTESDDPQRQGQGLEYYDRAVALYQQAGLKEEEAETFDSIGDSLQDSDDPKQKVRAVDYYQRAANVYAGIPNRTLQVNEILAAARVWETIASDEAQRQAALLYEQGIAVYDDDLPNQLSTLIRIGRIFIRSNDQAQVAKTEKYFHRAVDLARKKAGPAGAASTYLDIGVAYQSIRRYPLAIENFERSRSLYQELNDDLGQGLALYRLAAAKNLVPSLKPQATELANQSLAFLTPALPKLDPAKQEKKLADGYYAMGYDYYLKKDPVRQLDSYEQALHFYTKLPDQKARAASLRRTIVQLRRRMETSTK